MLVKVTMRLRDLPRARLRVLVSVAAVTAAAACSSATASEEPLSDADLGVSTAPVAHVSAPATTEVGPPLLDARATRFKETLAAEGLVAEIPDETLLAVARGLCDQISGGVPEDRILETVRPIAAYAASVSASATPGDDAARRYVAVARETFC
ncbi:DUF732 domain-containing protein [Rhodococcus chondri]|uniref:DUF732 domain-containing protein n=1 Tax=Rhodococcus chondri TaxID=3065941 RepID=A0ABU7JZ89_9NOCA|nr:DUF732 domain-containing protein [Rhodococcus sp. CC-R104]MEE2034889.1 hypothetical protein [Rhodococcus sp. CC-R104]